MAHVDVLATYEGLSQLGSALTGYPDSGSRRLNLTGASDQQLQSWRFEWVKSKRQSDAALASLELLRRSIKAAGHNPSPRQHQDILNHLVWIIRGVMRGRRTSTGRRMVAELLKGQETVPKAQKEFADSGARIDPQVLQSVAGLEVIGWRRLVEQCHAVAAQSKVPAADRVNVSTEEPLSLDVASRLARIAAAEGPVEATPLPTYDASEKHLRLSQVSVTGFRGSPGSVELDLTKNGKPVDVLLWGDNGVGKSTLVDGIEFALQGRVDRSADFASSLRPKVRNLSVPVGEASVTLSDDTKVTRSLVVNEAGRDVTSDLFVRPGFRIAPVVIRRADILRFLDIDGLSRGTVFFDYFPDPSGGLGTRPDEDLKIMDEERSILLVARADLAAQLGAIYPTESGDLANAQHLDALVERLIADVDAAPGEDPVDRLPETTRRLIKQLRETQTRLRTIKKKVEKGVERNNPVAYRAQLARVEPALRSVGRELTNSFQTITRASHVESLEVLVAKSGPVSLDVVVRFDNGSSALPQQAFSEGYKDLIALLFFLAVTKKAGELGQAHVLVLDDALQSVDASVRVGVMNYLLEHFKDWQLIVTGHDRGWLRQLRPLFNKHGRGVVERTISRWSFGGGIEVSGAARLRVDTVRAGLEQHDERMTAAAVGILLEEICQELSWRLEASVQRRQGDRYSLGDLWPGIAKKLSPFGLKNTIDGINQRMEVRNLLGGHFNEYADSIAWSDVTALADDVLNLYQSVHCSHCDDWAMKDGSSISCKCGALVAER